MLHDPRELNYNCCFEAHVASSFSQGRKTSALPIGGMTAESSGDKYQERHYKWTSGWKLLTHLEKNLNLDTTDYNIKQSNKKKSIDIMINVDSTIHTRTTQFQSNSKLLLILETY